jgi:membrane fusion protein (multidrug efflux system)
MRSRFHLILGAAVLSLSLVIMACGNAQSERDAAASAAKANVTPVRVRTLESAPFAETLHVTGYIEALEDITLSTEEGGVLQEWLVPKGRRVTQGQLIGRLKGDIAGPQFQSAEANFRAAELTYQKQRDVYKEQAISELQLKTSEFARDAAKAQAELARARFERTQIVSPVNGILDNRFVEVGELAPPGSPVARIVHLDRVKAVLLVPERYAGTVTRGTTVDVTVTAFPNEKFSGTITYVGAAVIADNRSIPIEVTLVNTKLKLKPEMIARAALLQSESRNVIVVDEASVVQFDQERRGVYVVENGVAVSRVVTTGARSGGTVEILSGLKAGDRLIVSGYQQIADGKPVEIIQ